MSKTTGDLMRIATMVRGYLPVPRPNDIVYAPIDLAVELTKGLQKIGHTVDFFAPKGSRLGTKVETCGIKPLVKNQTQWEGFLHDIELHMHSVPHLYDAYFAREMFERAAKGEYDLLHFHHPEIGLPLAGYYPDVSVIYTVHDPLDSWYNYLLDMYKSPNQYLISISNSQRAARPRLNYAATVYNGVDTDIFLPTKKHDGFLLFVGRITKEKGLREAIKVAEICDLPLIIAGPIFPDKQAYFNKYIKPYLNDKIRYIGYVKRQKLLPYFQKAKALLMPVKWEEPFGMNMIEAMACGTPVIAFNRGSVPEVVIDGKTGFVVDTLNQMVKAVAKIDTINRDDCRRHVVDNFSVEKW